MSRRDLQTGSGRAARLLSSTPMKGKRRRLALWIGVSILLLGGCVALLRPAPPEPLGQYIHEDGNYEVGCSSCEMGAGTWRVRAPWIKRDGNVCQWIRSDSKQNSNTNQIERGQVKPGESAKVTVRKGEWLTTMNCGQWERIAR